MASKDKGGRETRKPKKDKKAKPITPTIVSRPMGAPKDDSHK